MDRTTIDEVWRRAGGACEYCQLPQRFDSLRLQIEHIIPRKHRGGDDVDNLALACFACNNHKSSNLSGLNDAREIVRLFHPRSDRWDDHFQWQNAVLVGTTDVGRVTVDVLCINLPYRVQLREALIAEGVFPM